MKPAYCEAVTRRQAEATSWGDAHISCGNRPIRQGDDGGWYCKVHLDPAKRYGRNRRRNRRYR